MSIFLVIPSLRAVSETLIRLAIMLNVSHIGMACQVKMS